MKTLVILCSAIILTTSVFAQKKNNDKTAKTTQKIPMQDGIMKKDGKTWYIKSLTETMQLDNGVSAMTDGTVKITGGKTISLHEGDAVNFHGQMIGLNQKYSTVDGLVMKKNGTMWIWSVLSRPFQLKNSTYAMPDGTIKMADGKYTKMKDNEFVDLDGNTSVMSK